MAAGMARDLQRASGVRRHRHHPSREEPDAPAPAGHGCPASHSVATILVLETMPSAANRAGAKARAFGFLSLFTSAGTLIRCALAGDTVAAQGVGVCQLRPSDRENSVYVYGLTPRLQATRQACAPDAAKSACGPAERLTRTLSWISAAPHGVDFFSAGVLGWLLV